MRHITRYTILLLILTSIAFPAGGCRSRRGFYCGTTSKYDGQPKVESRILLLEVSLRSDTSMAVISGIVYTEERSDSTIVSEPAYCAIVTATDKLSGRKMGKPTDFDGKYSFCLPPSDYTLSVQYTGYTKLIVPNVTVRPGDKIEFNSLLGRASSAEDTTIVIKVVDEQRKPR